MADPAPMPTTVSPAGARFRRPLTGLALAAALVLALLAAGCAPDPSTAASAASSPTVLVPNAVVERVIDGDTVNVRIAGSTEAVRLIGIDTPETVDQRRPVQCFGPEASARTAELLPAGTPVHLQIDAEPRDAFDRLLVYLYRATDGVFVNLDLASTGHAAALTIAPNDTHAGGIEGAAAAARAADRGLWGACGGPGVPVDRAPGE